MINNENEDLENFTEDNNEDSIIDDFNISDDILSESEFVDDNLESNSDIILDLTIIITDSDTTEKTEESKHKIKGKHALSHDSIFKGKKKKDENSEDDESSTDFLIPKQENFDFDVSSGYHEETKDPEEYVRLKKLKETIYIIIIEKTDINIKNPRRKPARIDFNKYYSTLVENLDISTNSYGEIFIELAFYFSDNIFNMFKLLDKKWGGKIIKELARKRNIKIDKMDFL